MADNNYTLRIVKVAQEQAYNDQNKLVDVIRIDFAVGDHGPFTKRFAAADFDQNAARLALEQFARSIQQLGS